VRHYSTVRVTKNDGRYNFSNVKAELQIGMLNEASRVESVECGNTRWYKTKDHTALTNIGFRCGMLQGVR